MPKTTISMDEIQARVTKQFSAGLMVQRDEAGRLSAEGVTNYDEHFRISQDADGTWRATDGQGEMFRGLDSEELAWVMANYAYAIAAWPLKGETPEETHDRISRTISIKAKEAAIKAKQAKREMRRLKTLVKHARRSKQTEFESSRVLPDDEGYTFFTVVPDAPLSVIGRLGRDGKWYIGYFGPPDQPMPVLPEREGIVETPDGRVFVIVLREEPVAERIVRWAIRRALQQPDLAETDPNRYRAFISLLREGRFRNEEGLQ